MQLPSTPTALLPSRDSALVSLQARSDDKALSTPESSDSAAQLSDLVLQAIVANKGNNKAAAEYLKNHHQVQLEPASLIDYLSGRLPELKEKMELVATLEMFGMLPQLQKAFMDTVGDLDASSAARSYTDILKLIQQSTSKNELTLNVHEEIWHRAPRDIQRLFAALEAQGQLSALDTIVIDHDEQD